MYLNEKTPILTPEESEPDDLNSSFERTFPQREDLTMGVARKKGHGKAGPGFVLDRCVLATNWRPEPSEHSWVVEQGKLKKKVKILYEEWSPMPSRKTETWWRSWSCSSASIYCRVMLKLANQTPLACHVGRKKTFQRVAKEVLLDTFFWRREGDLCQMFPDWRNPLGRKLRASLIPVIEELICIDSYGHRPTPPKSRGRKGCLWLCYSVSRSHSTRSVDTELIAEELLEFISCRNPWRGDPDRLWHQLHFHDDGWSYRLFNVLPILTCPYHSQTDGLVERFN